MKIKNEYVTIKTGKKNITLRNTIMNTYLSRFKSNTSEEYNYTQWFDRCYIKLDTPLSFEASDSVHVIDFNFYFTKLIREESISNNSSTINYYFTKNVNKIFNALTDNEEYASKYVGRKITAIGFFSSEPFGIMGMLAGAILDVSNYDIYYEENFSVTRRDTISTDGIFVSQSTNIEYPLHLKFINNDDGINTYISHIGLGNSIDKISKIYKVGVYESTSIWSDEQYVKFYAINSSNAYGYIPNHMSLCRSYMPRRLAFYLTSNCYKYVMFVYTCKKNDIDYGQYWEVVENKNYGNTYAIIKFERS